MAGAGIPRYDYNGRLGTSDTAGLAGSVEVSRTESRLMFSMTTLLNPKLTLNYLAYLGYSSSPAADHAAISALHITRPRKQDRRQKKVARNVFLCYVLGATGSGKTSLLRRFVNKRTGGDGLGSYEPTTKVLSVVNSVEMEGQEKYLVVSSSCGTS
jgi:Ras family protein T1